MCGLTIKSHDIVPQSSLKIYKMYGEVIKFIENPMKNWRVELTAGGKNLSWGENSVSDLPGWCDITITICISNDAIQLHI